MAASTEKSTFPSSANFKGIEAGVRSVGVGDVPADVDALGFGPYVEAVAEFLIDPKTKPPLTLSLEGSWGSGKSSFAKQLAVRLSEKHITASFNPWLHETGDALWAAFALQVIRQLSSRLGTFRRAWANLRLFYIRFDGIKAFPRIAWSLILLALIISASIVEYNVWVKHGPTVLQSAIQSDGKAKSDDDHSSLITVLVASSGWLSVAILGFILLRKNVLLFGNPFTLELGQYVDDPNYRFKENFFEIFRRDFGRVLDVYVRKSDRLYVFVDDLDRCAADDVAEVVEALNLLTNVDQPDAKRSSKIVFVVSLDRKIVSAALAAKHDKQLDYLYESGGSKIDNALRFGYSFVDKFVQVPFQIPIPTEQDVSDLLNSIEYGQSSQAEGASQTHTINISRSAPEDREAILALAPSLQWNPRKIKQLVNLLRLHLLVAERTGLLEPGIDQTGATHPRVLAKWLALQLQWPTVAMRLSSDPTYMNTLQANLTNEDFDIWRQYIGLRDLLVAGSAPQDDLTEQRLVLLARIAQPWESADSTMTSPVSGTAATASKPQTAAS